MSRPPDRGVALERVVLDSSVLLGGYRLQLSAGAALGYYTVYWSSWIVAELVRNRTEWIAVRAVSDRCDLAELRRRFRESRRRVNAVMDDLARTLRSVDYAQTSRKDLNWLRDRDDWPIMQTALAAQADTLVTDNSRDFPLGEQRNGTLILGPAEFLAAVYAKFPGAEAAIRQYLQAATPSGRSAPNA